MTETNLKKVIIPNPESEGIDLSEINMDNFIFAFSDTKLIGLIVYNSDKDYWSLIESADLDNTVNGYNDLYQLVAEERTRFKNFNLKIYEE
jgi:hypothetical protein